MEEEFSCSICLQTAEDAVETTCCHHVFCEVCLSKISERECPACRQSFRVVTSHLARRIIGNMITNCRYENCGVQLTRSELKTHQRNCMHRTFRCTSERCKFVGAKEDYLSHLLSVHGDVIVEHFREVDLDKGVHRHQREDILTSKRNSEGREARLGMSGKYYCSGSLGENECSCCDGVCGPTNGCNCRSCMKLDVTLRMLPREWLVNREGAPCRKSKETGSFYCGRKMLLYARGQTEGYCGPDRGSNCEACQIVQSQHSLRYNEVW